MSELRRIGIVGHEAAKFTPTTEELARRVIRVLIEAPCIVVSGGCHLGGVDIWAEEEADKMGRAKLIFPPRTRSWETGFKPRNIQIAENSDEVHCIIVAELPHPYRGMRFDLCYHCGTRDHVKSGGCWTAKYAQRLGKAARWHIVGQKSVGVSA